jgi:hypothetical protein
MGKLTKIEFYLYVLSMAAKTGDNKILLDAITALAFRTAEQCGRPDVVRVLNHIDVKVDAWGNIDRRDEGTRGRLLLTAANLLTIVRDTENNGEARARKQAARELEYVNNRKAGS